MTALTTSPSEPHPSAAAATPTPLRGAYWRYALGLLTLIYTLNFLDRQIVNILAEPMKAELGLHDWQLGVLTGLSFAVVYAAAAIPLARIADRGNRPQVIAASLTVWSVFTAVCGLASGFWHLAASRLVVGLGESGCAPAAHSLIMDYTPKAKRAFAFGLFNAGLPIGGLIGLAVGGIVADQYGWRVAFMLAGLPGVLVAGLVAITLKEPRRGLPKTVAAPRRFRADAAELLGKKAFIPVALAGGLIALRGYGTAAFVASFFFRLHGQELKALADQVNAALGTHFGPAAVLGPTLGVLGGVAGITGTILGGMIADAWVKRDPGHYGTVPAIPQVVAAPFLILGLFWPGLTGALLLMTIPSLLSSMSSASLWASIQGLATPATRATASAIGLLVTVLIGLGVGPLLIGLLSDGFAILGLSTGKALRTALLIAEAPALAAAVLLWRARIHLRREIQAF